MKGWRTFLLIFLSILLVACGSPQEEGSSQADFETGGPGEALTIVSGSENKELEPILEDFSQSTGISVEMTYMGSVDIMKQLESGQMTYDAVWPASSIWLSLGDSNHQLKHDKIISISPVAFGVRQSLAEELGWLDQEVHVEDIIQAIQDKKLSFAMTNASQSNSGASAYLGFLTALSQGETLTSQDLAEPQLRQQITILLSGVNRTSGSSNWLVDLFLSGDYDAMVNYETLIIQTNRQLVDQGKEPLALIYPVDGISISDSPLAYLDQSNAEKEEQFLQLQDYLLSEAGQAAIEETGRRNAYSEVSPANQDLFTQWGIDLDRILSPITLPSGEVILEALKLYQTQFKKPALTAYVLDYSGSMKGEGHDQLLTGLEQIFLPENQADHLLLATDKDVSIIVPFSSNVLGIESARGSDTARLYQEAQAIQVGGGTNLHQAIQEALDYIIQGYCDQLDQYTVAVVALSDGRANDSNRSLIQSWQEAGYDIPIFSLMYGSADQDQLQELADLTHARVFDGRENLMEAFRIVKGYN
ncbi:substrate-binding and vWA domain-containing protein [Hutsoniella sourekii]